MKSIFKYILTMCSATCCRKNWLLAILLLPLAFCLLPASAQNEEPVITFRTTLYEDDGESNAFSIAMGATEEGTYVDIDCGFGSEEFEVGQAYIEGDSTLAGSTFSGKVSKEGIVKIYCDDPSKLDYFNASGCYITDIQFSDKLTSMQIINLEYNTLKSLNVDALQNLAVLYLRDNPFTPETPLMIGYLPKMTVLEVAQVGYISSDFKLSNFPALQSFDAYHCLTLTKADPTQNPVLTRLSLEMTNVSSVDVTKNPYLLIFNVSNTKVKSIDVSQNSYLQELYCNHSGSVNADYKLDSIDVTHNPDLYYFFAAGNNLKSLDVSKNPILFDFCIPDNKLTSIDLSANTGLYNLNLANNDMDYATLPLPEPTWSTYYYNQHDFQCDETYKVGDVLDFSSRVLREGTLTSCKLYYVEKDAPSDGIELPDSCYSYTDGKITLLKPWDKEIYADFSNDNFSDYDLLTTRFTVKSTSEFGKDEKAIQIASNTPTGKEVALTVGVEGATKENPVKVSADFGDGELKTFTITSDCPEANNIKGTRPAYGNIYVYVPQDKHISALMTDGLSITNVDLTNLTELKTLKLKNAGLYSVDLSYNSKLETLDLSGNNLTKVDLKGPSYYFYKGKLHDINLSNNQLDSLKFNDLYAVKNIDLSHNRLTSVDFSDADNILTVNLSDNKFKELLFNYSDSLRSLDVSNNLLDTLYVPSDAPLNYCNISGNPYTLADMPMLMSMLSRVEGDGAKVIGDSGLSKEQATTTQYPSPNTQLIYAPMSPMSIAESSPGVDLSSQCLTKDGQTTAFTWKKEDGTLLTEGTDYTINQGNTKFLNTTCGKVYCEMTHGAYPQFTGDNAFKTTFVQPISAPTVELASFTTTEEGDTVELSLAANKEGTSVYFDWNGDGNVTQYTLTTTYQRFYAVTKANKKVKVLVADKDDTFNVFSITGAKMSSIDLSGLKSVFAITIAGAGLSEISLPQLNGLGELNLSNNNLTAIDFSKCPNLYYLSLNGNKFTSVDLSPLEGLGLAFLGNNQLTSITLKNKNLWNLDLGSNCFTTVDFTGAPNIEQLWVNDNQLTSINVDCLKNLKVFDVARNKFTFATLPIQKEKWTVYSYGKQQNLDITPKMNVVDLSEMAAVGDSITTFRWFIGTPTTNEDTGELEGEELYVDEEYTTVNGVTTFHFENDMDDIVGVFTNPQFPNLTLYTNPFTVKMPQAADVNEDGNVDISDVNLVISVICGNTTNNKADVNLDGVVDISDVNMVISVICGK